MLCSYLSNSRTYACPYNLEIPIYFSAPAMDLINHDDQHNIFYEAIVNVRLEMSDEKICSELGYQKQSSIIDLTPLFGEVKEKPIPQKSRPILFLEASNHKVEHPFNLSIVEERKLAGEKAVELIYAIEELQIWNIPNWISPFHEIEESPQDIVESEDFEDMLQDFKELLRDPR